MGMTMRFSSHESLVQVPAQCAELRWTAKPCEAPWVDGLIRSQHGGYPGAQWCPKPKTWPCLRHFTLPRSICQLERQSDWRTSFRTCGYWMMLVNFYLWRIGTRTLTVSHHQLTRSISNFCVWHHFTNVWERTIHIASPKSILKIQICDFCFATCQYLIIFWKVLQM